MMLGFGEDFSSQFADGRSNSYRMDRVMWASIKTHRRSAELSDTARLNRLLLLSETLEPRIALDSTVVFNELMYHPADEQMPEWIELYNQNALNMDLSGWSLAEGIQYTFPRGTVLQGGGYLVIASDANAMKAATGFEGALGPFTGRLSNGGERIELRNLTNRTMDAIDYDDEGKWPVGPDGSAATLAKQNQHTSTGDPANWSFSTEIGGTPGAANFTEPGAFVFQQLLPSGASATALVPSDDSLGIDWLQRGFDDSAWTTGTTGVGYDRASDFGRLFGLNLDEPPNGQPPIPMNDVNQSLYVRIPFQVDQAGFDILTLKMKYDDGFVAYLNGVEVAHANAPGRDGDTSVLSWSSGATESHGNPSAVLFADFSISDPHDLLVEGENVLAIHGLNSRLGGRRGDLLILPELFGGREESPEAVEDISLSFNELAPAGNQFWVELTNSGNQPIETGGIVLSAAGQTGTRYILSPAIIASGDSIVVTVEQSGLSPADGDKIFIYSPDEQTLLDAATVTNQSQARSEMHQGRWMRPSLPTPGEPNQFQFHDAIVINEFMYHAAPHYATADSPRRFDHTSLVSFDATWRYNQAGRNLGQNWASETYAVDDVTWLEGPGLLSSESPRTAARVRDETLKTELPRPRPEKPEFVTYYFQTEFDVGQTLDDIDILKLTHIVDDGAVFYLNGQEVLRSNMPTGPVTAATGATKSIIRPIVSHPASVPTDILKAGTNVLSAEVHLFLEAGDPPDVVFGAELVAGSEVEAATPGTPYAESSEEWIEIFNRGQTETIDLSGWSLEDAIDFTFPAGTVIAPQQYLVIANDPKSLEDKHHDTLAAGSVLGPFSRVLSNSNDRVVLLDENSNIADEVHYYDDGRWHEYADRGGSSLELRDPFADNTKPEAWAASVEGRRSEWQHFSYTRTVERLRFDANNPPVFQELRVGMLDSGEVLIDNVSVIEDPGGESIELIQNRDFTADQVGGPAGKWRFYGSHEDTHVAADPAEPTNNVLHLIAEARSNYFGNHGETTLANGAVIEDGKTYQISFDAKWVAGSPQLQTELYYKDAGRTSIITLPDRAGTPGARNSVSTGNIGPTYSGLKHHPVVPDENEPVVVSVSADDPNGVSEMTLVWATDGGEFTRTEMSPGAHGQYQATIPGQADGAVVQFYVMGIDSSGVSSTYPAAGTESGAMYKVVEGFQPDPLRHDFQLIMLPDEALNLYELTEIAENDLTPATVIYRGLETFYDVGARLRGRGSRADSQSSAFSVRFHPDQLFRGVHEVVTLDRLNTREIAAKHLINQAGVLGGMYDDAVFFRTPLGLGDGASLLLMAAQGDLYLDSQFENGAEGTLYKLNGITVIKEAVDTSDPESPKRYQPTDWIAGYGITDLGDDKEQYRWPITITSNRARDDYAPIIALSKAFTLEGQELQDALSQVIDVDQWMQTIAMSAAANIGDTYINGGAAHNLNLYVRPNDNKVLAFPWDWDFTFSGPPEGPFLRGGKMEEIVSIPEFHRIFSDHLIDMVNTVFYEQYMAPWLDHYGRMLNITITSQTGGIPGPEYIRRRGEFILSQLQAREPFEISTNRGLNFTTSRPTTVLDGRGWASVREIRSAGQQQALPFTLLGVDRWRVELPLTPGRNEFDLEGYDARGTLVGSDQIVVTYQPNASPDAVLISEIHYNNNLLSAGSAPEEFEFIEVYNKSDHSVDLSDWRLSGDVAYSFPPGTSMAPSQAITVFPFDSNDQDMRAALQPLFGVDSGSVTLLGPYSGELADGGGAVRLERPLSDPSADDPQSIIFALMDEVIHDDLPPWPVDADGLGSSLTRHSSIATGNAPSAWTSRPPSPGRAEFSAQQPGDSNGDGVFDQLDIVRVLQSGKYLSGQPATFAEGDWNEDGRFDSRDIVAVLQDGSFTRGNNAAITARLVDDFFASE